MFHCASVASVPFFNWILRVFSLHLQRSGPCLGKMWCIDILQMAYFFSEKVRRGLSPERIGKIATKVLAKRDHPSLVIVVCSF